jgi:uncharacterized membrane protein
VREPSTAGRTHGARGHVLRVRSQNPAGDDAPVTGPASGLASVVERNIDALISRRREQERTKPRQHRIADTVTTFTGSLRFVVLHLTVFGAWVVVNAGWVHLAVFGTWVLINVGLLPLPRFDRSFVILATVASVEAIFLSTFVLISQNRMQAQADARAELDLQISLLSEHEVTRVITLVARIAQHLGLDEANDPELSELARDVAPERVLDEIDDHQRKAAAGRPRAS